MGKTVESTSHKDNQGLWADIALHNRPPDQAIKSTHSEQAQNEPSGAAGTDSSLDASLIGELIELADTTLGGSTRNTTYNKQRQSSPQDRLHKYIKFEPRTVLGQPVKRKSNDSLSRVPSETPGSPLGVPAASGRNPPATAIHQPPADIGGTGSAKSTRRNPKCTAAPALSPANSSSHGSLPGSARAHPSPLQAAALRRTSPACSSTPSREKERLPAAPCRTTRPRSDEPGKLQREAHPGPSRQHPGSHQATKEAAALIKRTICRSAR
ncbi:hypothetical protein NDU88_001233 [Pleurodeles waltl]|uniref:Uncharacterized protein n=1 Tax=Pleurodeles waltl TaxID=8319 RepID=A0AAV7S9B8_PLEWA|nr:hypothetical protein NDU88_001233 [Pleurodeles waltl]